MTSMFQNMFSLEALPYYVVGTIVILFLPVYLFFKNTLTEALDSSFTVKQREPVSTSNSVSNVARVKVNKKKKSKKRNEPPSKVVKQHFSTEEQSDTDEISLGEENVKNEEEPAIKMADTSFKKSSKTSVQQQEEEEEDISDTSSPSPNDESGLEQKNKKKQAEEANIACRVENEKLVKTNSKKDKKKRYKAKRKLLKANENKEQSETAPASEEETREEEEEEEDNETKVADDSGIRISNNIQNNESSNSNEDVTKNVISLLKTNGFNKDEMIKLCNLLIEKLSSCGVSLNDVKPLNVTSSSSSSVESEVILKLTQDLKTMGLKLKGAVKIIEEERNNNKSLSEEIVKYEKETAELKEKLQQQSTQIQEATTKLDEKEKCIDELNKKVESFVENGCRRNQNQDEVGSRELDIEETIDVYQRQLTKLVNKSDYLEYHLEMKKKEVLQMKQSFEAMHRRLTEITEENRTLKEELLNKDNEISACQMQVSKKDLDLKSMLTSLKDTSAALESSNTKISDLEDEIVRRNSEIKVLTVQIEELESRLHDKEMQVLSFSEANAEKIRSTLEEKHMKDIALREHEISTLRHELNECQRQLNDSAEKNMSLVENNRKNESLNTVLLKEIDQSRTQIAALERQLEEKTNTIDEIQNKLLALEESSASVLLDCGNAKSVIEDQKKQIKQCNEIFAVKDAEMNEHKAKIDELMLSLNDSTKKLASYSSEVAPKFYRYAKQEKQHEEAVFKIHLYILKDNESEEEKRILKSLITENSVQLVTLQNEINELKEQIAEKSAINDNKDNHFITNEESNLNDLKIIMMKYFPNMDLDAGDSIERLDEALQQVLGKPILTKD